MLGAIKQLLGAGFCALWVAGLMVPEAFAEDETYRKEKLHIQIDVAADGSSVIEEYEVIEILSERAIDWYGDQWLYFSTSRQTLEIIEAFTELPDGTRVPVQEESIRLVEGDGSAHEAVYTDEQSYVVIFPQIVPGARTHLRTRLVEHEPLYAGHFSITYSFSPMVYYGEVLIDLTHDPAIDLELEAVERGSNLVYERVSDGLDGQIRYQARFSQPGRERLESSTVGHLDRNPYLRISSMPDMLTIGRLYQQSAEDKTAVTPSVLELAKEITAGIEEAYEQARALHAWVAREIRYVAIFLGDGGVVPHHADLILQRRHGDCKDSTTLYIALLAALGIEAEAALINAGDQYTLARLGGVGPFNHVITYLPQWDLYTDPTDPYAPFGVLSYDTSDKPTVLTQSAVFGRTPKWAGVANRTTVAAEFEIAEDGSIAGRTDVQVQGPSSRRARTRLLAYVGMYQDDIVARRLAAVGMVGQGGYTFEPMRDLSNPVAYQTWFETQPMTNFPGPGAMHIPVGLAPGLIGTLAARPPNPEHVRPFECLSYSVYEQYRIRFPETVEIAHLPPETWFASGQYLYRSSYRRAPENQRDVLVERELILEMPSQVCQPGDEIVRNELLGVIQQDLRGQISYRPNP